MKQVIHKYDLRIQKEFTIKVPAGSRILFVEMQGLDPRVWMIVDPEMERTEIRRFRMFATGEEFDSKGLNYVGSVMIERGILIYHYFEVMMPV